MTDQIHSGASEKVRNALADAFETGREALTDHPKTGNEELVGLVCVRHQRWCARWQHSDPCYAHVWRGAVIPGGVEDDS